MDYKQRDESLRELGFGSYEEYLRSGVWRWIRKQVMRRARGLCQSCKINKAVEVHHTSYSVRVLLGIRMQALVAVCSMCHEMAHAEELDKQ